MIDSTRQQVCEGYQKMRESNLKFSDVLRFASKLKESKGLSPELTRTEFKALREEYEKETGKVLRRIPVNADRRPATTRKAEGMFAAEREAVRARYAKLRRRANAMQEDSAKVSEFRAALRKLSELKRADGLSGKLTSEEIREVRRQLNELNTLRPETIKAYREAKIAEGLSPVISSKERTLLLEEQKKADIASFKEKECKCEDKDCKKAKAEEKKEKKEESKAFDRQAAIKKIREAREHAYSAKRHLAEGDMAAAQNDVQAADTAIQSVDAADGQIPQNIIDSIANVKASIEDLAAQAGIESNGADLGANPEANVPAVNGQPAEAEAAPEAPAPIQESKPADDAKLEEVKARISAREQTLSKIKESAAADYGKNVLADIGQKEPEALANPERPVDKKNDDSTLDMPTKSELEDGSAKDAIKWPTEKAKGLPTTLYEGKEDTESKPLHESEAEKYVDKKLQEAKEAEDWNWSKILSAGLLG